MSRRAVLELSARARAWSWSRLIGSSARRNWYVSGYTDDELDAWARRIRRWSLAGLDVYVYFDNDAKVHAPKDAERLMERIARRRKAGTPKKASRAARR